MHITNLTIYTSKLQEQIDFYSKNLNLHSIHASSEQAIFQVGWSTLTLVKGRQQGPYHFCFLIPENKIDDAVIWANDRLSLLNEEKSRVVHHFSLWNAHSIYFLDPDGNILEFIARHNLQNATDSTFDESQIICINEIGMPVNNIAEANKMLSSTMHTKLWQGDLSRFAVHGDEEALILLPHLTQKKIWYPTATALVQAHSKVSILNEGVEYHIVYDGEIKFVN